MRREVLTCGASLLRKANLFALRFITWKRVLGMEQVIETYSAEETYALGKKIGENAKPGQVYSLIGDLGVGKTVFTQGVADRKSTRLNSSHR